MKKISILLGLLLFTVTVIVGFTKINTKQDVNKDPKMNKFITQLMSKMTLEEKIGQLNLPGGGDMNTGEMKSTNTAEKVRQGMVGGLFNIRGNDKIHEIQRIAVEESRMKIPLIFGMDVIHGYETVFPIPLGMAATWDVEAVEESARVAALEATARGICWTFAPMVDLSRDPRWGRTAEGNGEDPFLGGQMAKAMVRGFQGDGTFETSDRMMGCVKHYALYGAADAGRDYNTVDMGRLRMFNEYMYPYQAAVDAGVGSVMVSFNEVDGVPATANKYLIDDILRKQWGFNGFVVTDYTGINEMVEHGIGDLQTVSARALEAGVDMDMVGEGFISTLAKSLSEKKIDIKMIDQACRRVLEAKYKLGLFDDPYRFCNEEKSNTEIYTAESRAIARKIAADCFVLMKNEGNILPIKKQGTIAVVGPLADSRQNMAGTWSVAAVSSKYNTVFEGITQVAGDNAKVVYAKGCNLLPDASYEARVMGGGRRGGAERATDAELLKEALAVVKNADVIVAAMGEAAEMSGESSSRSDLSLPETQKAFLKAMLATGKPLIMLNFSGRPVVMAWESENVPAILNVWFGGSETAWAIADVIFGDVNPNGKLVNTFPRNMGQIPIYYNHKNTGRPSGDDSKITPKFRTGYLDVQNDPLYPFGYGLSYTTFEYSDVTLSKTEIDGKGSLTASITVKNAGKVDGKEVVQLYIRDVVGSITRPLKELKGWEKVMIKAGDSKTIDFTITPEMLKFFNSDLNYVFEPGEFDVMIGGNSADVKKATFTLK